MPGSWSRKAIIELRYRFGLSQEAFANQLDVSPSIVQKWESGERTPGDQSSFDLDLLAQKSPDHIRLVECERLGNAMRSLMETLSYEIEHGAETGRYVSTIWDSLDSLGEAITRLRGEVDRDVSRYGDAHRRNRHPRKDTTIPRRLNKSTIIYPSSYREDKPIYPGSHNKHYDSASTFLGVSRNTNEGSWIVKLSGRPYGPRQLECGRYDDERHAAFAFNLIAWICYGDTAPQNDVSLTRHEAIPAMQGIPQRIRESIIAPAGYRSLDAAIDAYLAAH